MRKIPLHLLILALLILLGICIRVFVILDLPIPHEMGDDSFFYHKEVNILITYHSFIWWLHPLSLWGLYPYSDSPGSPTYVAEISIISGLPVEVSILVYDAILVIVGGISMYILSLKISRKLIFPVMTTFVFLMAPILFIYTIWSLGEREFLTYLLPLLTLMIIYILKENDMKSKCKFLIFLLIPLIFVLSTIHLISIFAYGLVISGILMFFIKKIPIKKVYLHFNQAHLKSLVYIFSGLVLFYLLFILNNFVNLPLSFSLKNYENTAIFSGIDPFTILVNVGVSLSGAVGILFPVFFPLGFLWLIFKIRNTIIEKYILFSLLISLPIIINRLYSRPVMIFLSTLFIGWGCVYLFKIINKRKFLVDKKKIVNYLKIAIVAILFLSSSAFTIGYYEYREQNNGFAPELKYTEQARESTYEMGIYQHNRMKGIWIGNNWLMDQRIQAYSNEPFNPGINNFADDPVFYGLVNTSVLKIHPSSTYWKYTARYYVSDYYFEQRKDYNTFFFSQKTIDANQIQGIIKKYHIRYLIIDRDIRYEVCSWSGREISRQSKTLQTLDNQEYKLFINSKYIVYNL